MSWAPAPIPNLGPLQSLPSFSDFVTSLGQDAIPSAPYELCSAGTPGSGSVELAWPYEQSSRPTNNIDQVHAATTKRTLITPSSTPDRDYPVDFVRRPNLKRPHRDDAELPVETVPDVSVRDQPLQSGTARTASPCLFDGYVPFKKPRRDRNQPLNPLYTRDGSLRKRLAQACERCRTQKIKCRLEGLACSQCVKQGLKCEFSMFRHKRAVKGRQREAQASQQPGERSPDEAVPQIPATVKSERPGEGLVEVSDPSPMIKGVFESNGDSLTPSAAGSSGDDHQLADAVATIEQVMPTEARQKPKPPAVEDLSIDIDPILFDPKLTRHYCGQYFTHIDRPPYRLLPRTAVFQWLDAVDKSTNEKMLLYAILAAGAIFSQDKSHDGHRIVFTQITEDALHACQNWFELPVIHTLLVLTSVCALSGDVESAHAHSIAAMRCCSGTQLNNEPVQSPGYNGCGYVGVAQLAECGKRTFWLAYIRTVLWGSPLHAPCGRPQLQGHLSLPCDDADYEAGAVPDSPMLRFPLPDVASRNLSEPDTLASSSMALMIKATLALDSSTCLTNASCDYPVPSDRAASWASATQNLHRQLHNWRQHTKQLALSHRPSTIPAEHSLMTPCISMNFHRRAPPDLLPPAQATYHYRQTRRHATHLLETLDDICQDVVSGPECTSLMLDPFISTAIVSAFDVLTSASLLSNALDPRQRSDDGRLTLRALATLAITVVSDLAEYSRLAEGQLGPMKKRLAALLAGCNAAQGGKRAFCFTKPLMLVGGGHGDGNGHVNGKACVIYGMSKAMVLGALGVESRAQDELLEMV